MNKINEVFISYSRLHLAGQFLSLSIFLVPTLRTLLYPITTGGGYPLFYILISLIEVFFILIIFLHRQRHCYAISHLPRWLWLVFVIWAVVALADIPQMPLQAGGVIVTTLFFIHFFFLIALCGYLKIQPKGSKFFLYALITGFLLFLPFFWIRVYVTYDQPGFDWTWSLPGFENVRHLDYYLGSLVALLGLLPLMKTTREASVQLKFLIFLLLLTGWVMLFWSGGRGSALAACGAVGICLLLFRPPLWQRIALYNLAALSLGIVISLLLPQPNDSYGLFRFIAKVTDVSNFNEFSAGRWRIWQESIAVWQQNIWLGSGAGQTKTLITATGGTFGQPHNIFIQALMAWGIIGGLPFLGGIFIPLWQRGRKFFTKSAEETSLNMIGYGIALMVVINSLVDGTLYYPFPLFIFIIGLTISLQSSKMSFK